jgi:hypothetical protein
MDYQQIREYQIKQRARNVSETPWLILPGENKLTRRAVKFSFIKDHKDPDKFVGIHAECLFQKRKNQKEPWPSRTINLAEVPSNFGFRFSLDSAQTYELAQALQDAYPIGNEKIGSGKRTVLRGIGKDEVIVTERNKAKILQQLTSLLNQDDVNHWIGENISAISTDLALARLYSDRKSALKELKVALGSNGDERFWQEFLKGNSWMFGSSYVELLSERRFDIKNQADFPMRIEGGFMDIIEIKTPHFPFWTLVAGKPFKYRGKFLIPHTELQGAIAQTTKYILQAEKQLDSAEYIKNHGGALPLKPRGLIIHGRSDGWTADEWEAFRLLNDELHTVQVITFDHLFKQAERILTVTKMPDENPTPEEVGIDQIAPEDLRF